MPQPRLSRPPGRTEIARCWAAAMRCIERLDVELPLLLHDAAATERRGLPVIGAAPRQAHRQAGNVRLVCAQLIDELKVAGDGASS